MLFSEDGQSFGVINCVSLLHSIYFGTYIYFLFKFISELFDYVWAVLIFITERFGTTLRVAKNGKIELMFF